jgi:hypothetical protein
VLGTVQVSNNLAQASFSLTGPIKRNGQGLGANYTNAPSGTYVIRFGDVPYYETPPPQTNDLSGNSILFQGTYTFVDRNGNGISDPWEQNYFGVVRPSHPGSTDTDGDGSSDYAEFVAGTDPTNRASTLQLLPPVRLSGGTCRLSWAAVPGRSYRVLTSNDAVSWAPLTAWMRASSSQLSYNLPVSTVGRPLFFRLEAVP